MQKVGIDELRRLSDPERVRLLTTKPEGQWFERTSSRIKPRDLADKMIGFANAEGGVIAIGIHDAKVEGIGDIGSALNAWRQAALDFTEPPVRNKVEVLPSRNWVGEDDEVVLVSIEPSDRVHTNTRDQTFLRVGDENRRLGPVEAQELRFDKGESTFDGSPADGTFRMGDLDPKLVQSFSRKVSATVSDESVLLARGLAIERDGETHPTVAGLLTLGSAPQMGYPQAFVRVLRYQGTSRETGARSNVLRDRTLDGPIPRQIQFAGRLIRRWLPAPVRLQPTGKFAPAPAIPEFAWLEAIVNAVVHRSYSMGGDHIRVEIFDDRVVVESPGRLPGLVRLDNIRRTRFARNPRIARAVHELGYGRELGEGVDRMFDEMERAGLPDPIYTEGAASVRVTLLSERIAKVLLELLPAGSERFVEYLIRLGRLSTTSAVQLLGLSRPTTLKYLHLLEDFGLVEHIGSSPKDPRGFWRLIRSRTGIGA